VIKDFVQRTMNTRHNTTAVVLSSVLAMALVGLAGCGSMDWKPSKIFSLDSSWPFGDDEPKEGTPVRMVGAWTDTVLAQPGKNPQRGFGGRLMFYSAKEEKPILVDGQLVVYAFDETGRGPTDNKPTRRYVFPAEQMPSHMSKSDMGASYSFWLPWDEAGGPKTEVSLVCRFEPKGGAVITSEQTHHLLPGAIATNPGGAQQPPRLPEGVPSQPAQTTLESLRSSQRIDANLQPASFNGAETAPGAMPALPTDTAATMPARQMSVTSIALPDSFRHRNAASGDGMGGNAPVSPPVQSQSLPTHVQQQPAANYSQPVPANSTFSAPQAPRGLANVHPAPALQRSWPSVPTPQITRPTVTTNVAPTLSMQTSSWNAPVPGRATVQQPPYQPTYPQQGLVQQQASQPMPAPTPVTTKVSYPSYRPPAAHWPQVGQPPSFHSLPAAPQAQGQ
jgi:hypothetical protein